MSFVLLYHEMPPDAGRASHWDLMIEDPTKAGQSNDNDRRLWTWALDERPAQQVDSPERSSLACARLADHRASYLTYEGEISGGRGRVRRVDAGGCEVLETLADNHGQPTRLVLRMEGKQLRGTFVLEQASDQDHERKAGSPGESWRLTWAE